MIGGIGLRQKLLMVIATHLKNDSYVAFIQIQKVAAFDSDHKKSI